MSRWFVRCGLFTLTIGVLALVVETRRLAALVGRSERDAFVARQAEQALRLQMERAIEQAAIAVAEPAADEPASSEPADSAPASIPGGGDPVALGDYTRLQLELHTARQQLANLTTLLDRRNAELTRRALAADERAASALAPMPEGVRSCLEGLHACLRAEGFYQQRFLRASALDQDGLHDVEMLDASVDGLAVAFLHAAQMTADLDRANGRFELRFFAGHRIADGKRVALPEEGWPVVFDDVDGRLIEQRLPFLVRAQGTYPAHVLSPARPPTDVDAGTQRQWLRRLERILSLAKTDKRWRATRLRGIEDGYFLAVQLVGTNDNDLVLATAHCQRVAIEVDEASGVVSLLMRDGVLRQDGIESTITDTGFRMLLPGLTAKQASDAMIGMVVTK